MTPRRALFKKNSLWDGGTVLKSIDDTHPYSLHHRSTCDTRGSGETLAYGSSIVRDSSVMMETQLT